jgi:hypothetical protein
MVRGVSGGGRFFRGHMVRCRGDERNFGDHVIGKGMMKSFSDCMVWRRGKIWWLFSERGGWAEKRELLLVINVTMH